MTCNHREPDIWVWEDVEVGWLGETEPQLVNTGSKSTQIDIGIGAFKCTQCGEIEYYTGKWKAYHEQGIPCSGSDNQPRFSQLNQKGNLK